MKELIELRVDEDFAPLIFPDSEGKHRGSIRVVYIDANDPRIPQIESLYRELDARNRSFYYGWKITRTYEKAELAAARLFSLVPTTFFEPCGEECGTRYDESTACPICGAGRRQVSELILPPSRIPKLRDLACTIANEIVVSQRFVDTVTEAQLTGVDFHPLRAKRVAIQESSKARRSVVGTWYQLVITSTPVMLSAKTRVGVRPIADDLMNGACPLGDTIGHAVLSELHVREESWDGADFLKTRQFVGVRRGYLAPYSPLLLSARARAAFEKMSLTGFQTEVAHLDKAS